MKDLLWFQQTALGRKAVCCLRMKICLMSWGVAACAKDEVRNSIMNVERIRKIMEFP